MCATMVVLPTLGLGAGPQSMSNLTLLLETTYTILSKTCDAANGGTHFMMESTLGGEHRQDLAICRCGSRGEGTQSAPAG